jgi:hypothetical protein
MTLTQGAIMLLTLVSDEETALLHDRQAKAARADCWATLSETGG